WKDNRLAEWQLKAFKEAWGESKLRDILYFIKVIIEKYKITQVALKLPNEFHSSAALNKLLIELQSMARLHKITVQHVSLSELKQLCSDSSRFSKIDLLRTIAEQNVVL